MRALVSAKPTHVATLLVACLLAAFSLVIATSMTASAITLENGSGIKKIAYYPNDGRDANWYYIETGKGDPQASPYEPKSVKSTNKSVIDEVYVGSGYLTFHVAKTGTAKIKYKWKGKKHTVTYKVYKYKKPVKTFKVGSKSIVSKFKHSSEYAKLISGKLNVKAAKGWKLTKLRATPANYEGYKTLKNGAKVSPSKYSMVEAIFKNKKTKVTESLCLYLADPSEMS